MYIRVAVIIELRSKFYILFYFIFAYVHDLINILLVSYIYILADRMIRALKFGQSRVIVKSYPFVSKNLIN